MFIFFSQQRLLALMLFTLSLTAADIKLLNADWSAVPTGTYNSVNRTFSCQIEVRVIDSAQEVSVHYLYNSTWEVGSASFLRPSKPGYAVWKFSVTKNGGNYPSFIGKEFALELEAAGQEYWDNNNGSNYIQPSMTGSIKMNEFPSMYVRGSFGWNTTDSIAMTKTSDDVWEVKNVAFGDTNDEKFKFDAYNDWSVSFGDDQSSSYAFKRTGYAEQYSQAADIEVPKDVTCDITLNEKYLKWTYSCSQVKDQPLNLSGTAVTNANVSSREVIFSANITSTLAQQSQGISNRYQTYIYRAETPEELKQKVLNKDYIAITDSISSTINDITITTGSNYERTAAYSDELSFYEAGKTFFYQVEDHVIGHHNGNNWHYIYKSNVLSLTFDNIEPSIELSGEVTSTNPISIDVAYEGIAEPNQGNTSCTAKLYKGESLENLKENVINGNSIVSPLPYTNTSGSTGHGEVTDSSFSSDDQGKTFFYQTVQHCSGHYTSASWNRLAISNIIEVPTSGSNWKRTIIMIEGQTSDGQDMFIRGGIDHGYANSTLGRNCTTSNFECAIPIRFLNTNNGTTDGWKAGDNYLDWYGKESTQGDDDHGAPLGSALDWTTNAWPLNWGTKPIYETDGYGETPLNTYGHHYWIMEVDMDCSATVNGWFELKSFISNGPGWEGDVSQSNTPYNSGNHFAQCGKKNVFKRGQSEPVEIK